jgi:hypothetical protein
MPVAQEVDMRQATAVALATGFLLLAACDSPTRVAGPKNTQLFSLGSGNATRPVQMLDECDPDTFNAAIGPGTCVSGHSGVTFDKFLAQLVATQRAPAWRFAAPNFTVPYGATIVATNRGGEFHTFTRVAAYGGGVVPFLNQLAGTPIPAPECLVAPPSEYISPGGSDTDLVDQHGTLYFECCIHPWMRTTVTVH